MIYEDTSCYDDIINLEHPNSVNRAKMTRLNRAAQFAPFAALTGHGDAIKETARVTSEKIQLDEYVKAELDYRLQIMQRLINNGEFPRIRCEYFKPDVKKAGGSYIVEIGVLRKINDYKFTILLEKQNADGEFLENLEIQINDIIDLSLLNELNDYLS